jgi:hypothetical protein
MPVAYLKVIKLKFQSLKKQQQQNQISLTKSLCLRNFIKPGGPKKNMSGSVA